ncbi:hypothetical protein PHJA_002712300 [Phtheirospermum japonicum]|uniref:Uncharacterized protein n=1 Tax=Phtheirospermum japonicum TaxID=374723 RepID=A0A830DI18_9LAMI|nr:hypothetical protein PHJA_002712300 [Phtheirospermum japonicum]
MKKNQKPGQEHDHHIEILKAVAQAWHSHSSGSKSTSTSTSEFDAHRRFFKGRPSRFKIEASNYRKGKYCGTRNWDFRQSLWDSYEIVSVSKKLETGLVMDDPFSGFSSNEREKNGETKRRRESKNSLRSLFNRMSSRRFTDADFASGGD